MSGRPGRGGTKLIRTKSEQTSGGGFYESDSITVEHGWRTEHPFPKRKEGRPESFSTWKRLTKDWDSNRIARKGLANSTDEKKCRLIGRKRTWNVLKRDVKNKARGQLDCSINSTEGREKGCQKGMRGPGEKSLPYPTYG